MLEGFGAVPPLVTDINLSLDDRFLYLSCWDTGEMRQYDVSDPFEPRHTGSVHLGGIVRLTAHPAAEGQLNGAPQMVEVSRDGRRVYFSNSLYSSWDEQFYPDGIRGWVAKADAHESHEHWGHGVHLALTSPEALSDIAAIGVHTLLMFAVMAAVAILVYYRLGLMILKRTWFNVDLIWAGPLVVAGGIALVV